MSSTPLGAAESLSADAGLCVDIDTNVSLPHRRVRLHGELDLATAPLLASALDEHAAGCTQLDLDLSDLRFCDLVGLSTLEQAQQRLGQRGCRMRVDGVNGQVRRLLDIDGLRSPLSAPVTSVAANHGLPNPRRAFAKLLAGRLRVR
jgi:anti-sigma B factor antagonist